MRISAFVFPLLISRSFAPRPVTSPPAHQRLPIVSPSFPVFGPLLVPQYPISPFQAFAITLSSFDSKIACD